MMSELKSLDGFVSYSIEVYIFPSKFKLNLCYEILKQTPSSFWRFVKFKPNMDCLPELFFHQ